MKVWTLTDTTVGQPGSFRDMRTGEDLRLPGYARPRSHRVNSGHAGVLNRNDARREQRARDLANGLSDNGMASVTVLDAEGRVLEGQSFDPLDDADLIVPRRPPASRLNVSPLPPTILPQPTPGWSAAVSLPVTSPSRLRGSVPGPRIRRAGGAFVDFTG